MFDDEGNETQRNVLIENGILRGYLQDNLSSRITKAAPTGSGRRESYEHIPMPRMTNTFMLAGEACSDPADIVRSVPRGLFIARTSPGGQAVDITSGNFVFSGIGKLSHRRWQADAPGKKCNADRERSGSDGRSTSAWWAMIRSSTRASGCAARKARACRWEWGFRPYASTA